MLLSNLPDDIIYHILSYGTVLKYRNGKYMNQISKTDSIYLILTREVFNSRDMIHQTVSKPDDKTIKLEIYYRPLDIYWSISVNSETVIYEYSLSLDSYDSNMVYHSFVLK